MATLIIYSTKHGCTEKCALSLAGKLLDEVKLHNLKDTPQPDLTPYDTVVIGGSIYVGKIQKELQHYCRENLPELLKKRLGLFICCMYEGEVAQKQLLEAFPPEMVEQAVVMAAFGGEFVLEKMGLLEKMIVKKVAKVEHSVSKLSGERIEHFAAAMNSR